jgi:hypothetical protein
MPTACLPLYLEAFTQPTQPVFIIQPLTVFTFLTLIFSSIPLSQKKSSEPPTLIEVLIVLANINTAAIIDIIIIVKPVVLPGIRKKTLEIHFV